MKLIRFTSVLLATIALAACGKDAGGDKTGAKTGAQSAQADTVDRKEKDVRIFNRSLGEPEYLDPNLISESEGGIVTHDTFEGLYQYGPTHKDWPPGVAETHTLSEDGRTYTFKLRNNAKWSDGKPVTAHDFEYSWKRVLDPTTASRYGSIMWVLDGGKAFNTFTGDDATAKQALKDAVGVKATDDHTLVVTLAAPTPYFIQLTAFYSFAPVPRHVIEQHTDKWARPEHIVSNGPWHVTEWKSHQRIVAKINDHYWDKANVPFDTINYLVTQESEPAHNMYLSGDSDYLESKVPTSVLPRYRKEKFPDLKTSPYLGVYYYLINTKKAPFDNVKVRQALNLAIDKEKIGKFVAKGGQEEAWRIVHPRLADIGYTAPSAPEFDPDEARKLLAEAGFPGGKGFPNFQISYNTLEAHKQVAEFVQQEWKRNLGISCDLDNMEWKVLLKKHQAKTFDISRGAWIGDFVDPLTFLELWEGDNTQNHTGWDVPEYNAFMNTARGSGDQGIRFPALANAEKLFIEQIPAIPIYFYVKHDLVKPYLKGYKSHLQGIHASRYFKVEL